MGSRGLTKLQHSVLAVLTRRTHLHVITTANRVHTTRAQAQRALNTLDEHGLVERVPEHADTYRLTDAGRQYQETHPCRP